MKNHKPKQSYPYKTINGVKKRVHIQVIEENLGRTLAENEHVYHIDGNPKNYSLDNLIVIKKNIHKKEIVN